MTKCSSDYSDDSFFFRVIDFDNEYKYIFSLSWQLKKHTAVNSIVEMGSLEQTSLRLLMISFKLHAVEKSSEFRRNNYNCSKIR